MTKYDDYKKALENSKINRPEYRSENKTFCYPDEYGGVVVGRIGAYGSSELVILGIDDAIMMANFILDTFTDGGFSEYRQRYLLQQMNDKFIAPACNPQAHEQTK